MSPVKVIELGFVERNGQHRFAVSISGIILDIRRYPRLIDVGTCAADPLGLTTAQIAGRKKSESRRVASEPEHTWEITSAQWLLSINGLANSSRQRTNERCSRHFRRR